MSLENSNREFIKIQERFHFLRWHLSIEFSLFLLVVHGSYTRGLYITCTYFFLSNIFFFMTSGKSICECIKVQRRVCFFDGFSLLDFFSYLLLDQGFDTTGLFTTCMFFFFLSNIDLFHQFGGILFANS